MPLLLSTFTAVTELFVTVAVFAFLHQAYRNGRVMGGLIAFALTYEVLVNVAYMVFRLFAGPAEGHTYSAGMQTLLAVHGTLSLLMLFGLIALAAATVRAGRRGENHLRQHPRTTFAFVGLWTASVLTGEWVYAATYLF